MQNEGLSPDEFSAQIAKLFETDKWTKKPYLIHSSEREDLQVKPNRASEQLGYGDKLHGIDMHDSLGILGGKLNRIVFRFIEFEGPQRLKPLTTGWR